MRRLSRAESHGVYFSSKPTVTGSQKISRQRTSNTYFLFHFYFHFVKGGKDFVILHFILDINKVDKQYVLEYVERQNIHLLKDILNLSLLSLT